VAVANWLILELCDFIDNIGYKDIESAMTLTFGEGIEYFIPMHHEEMGSYTSTSTLMDGYVFVKDCQEARKCLINMRDQRLFSKVLCEKGQYVTVDSRVIAGLKHKLSNTLKKKFIPGIEVKILGGVFKNLIGEVIGIEDMGLKIMVKIKRRSREMIAPIPATLLEKIEGKI
jgi:transcription antitermination factor NusG